MLSVVSNINFGCGNVSPMGKGATIAMFPIACPKLRLQPKITHKCLLSASQL